MQVLLIGVGYDTRYLLLKHQINTQCFFELDFSATQHREKKIIHKNFNSKPLLTILKQPMPIMANGKIYKNINKLDLKSNTALRKLNFHNRTDVFIYLFSTLIKQRYSVI